ncbi:hypothetical protein GA0116948_105216 [Chitinophaga costaii]|uniref:Peptidase n=1 Tax=Chitinophaga costaii TaxID=1335309 RepID=A0A1C4DDF4_9BACT|nr:hypothetical protein [Chitinophaga costaii]PUZ24577.1 hypothetical protein DCM91_11830 [Chitinophaga costaii]SCC29402.1 hypothetical protein GA0116948_105216 [Chitinophaga costaii]
MKKMLLLLGVPVSLLALRVQAQTQPAQASTGHWKEHWFEHKEDLQLKFQNEEVKVYFDSGMPNVTWPFDYMSQVWAYTKKTYGNFGKDPQLYCIFHATTYSGGHPSTYFDASHDYHNTIDVGYTAPNAWTTGAGNDLDMCTHEVGHIVEGATHGIHNSPAFHIWGDSKWMEIYIYDVYKGLGRTADATRWYNMMMKGTDNRPRAGTHWFKDWFFPIYDQYGGTQVLQQYFLLQARYFPKNGQQYSRDMNMGEFVHFWSGAAGQDLQPLAAQAFGWNDDLTRELAAARKDFPDLQYKK